MYPAEKSLVFFFCTDGGKAAIKKANDAGVKCSVLTKGILPIELAEFSKENEYGITLITTDEAAFVLIQAPFVLSGGDHGDQLIFGDAPVAAGVEQFADALLEQAEQDGQGTQDGGEHPQEGGGRHGPGFCVFLGDGLGADLPEGEDDQGQDHGGDGGAILRAELGEEQGAQGGGGDVDNIIAHQKGGEQSVKIFSQAQGGLGLAVAVVRHVPQSDLVQRGKGGLGGGEVR